MVTPIQQTGANVQDLNFLWRKRPKGPETPEEVLNPPLTNSSSTEEQAGANVHGPGADDQEQHGTDPTSTQEVSHFLIVLQKKS